MTRIDTRPATIRGQAAGLRPVVHVTVPAVLVLAALAAGTALMGVPFGNLSRDPVAILDAPVYTGYLSSLVAVLWIAGATCCLLAAAALQGRSETRRFLLAAGALTALLGIDDLFLLHEDLFIALAGLPEPVTMAIYGLLTIALGVVFQRFLRTTRYRSLALAAAVLLAVAVTVDAASPLYKSPHLVEDGLKFWGVANWTAFCTCTSAQVLRAAPGR